MKHPGGRVPGEEQKRVPQERLRQDLPQVQSRVLKTCPFAGCLHPRGEMSSRMPAGRGLHCFPLLRLGPLGQSSPPARGRGGLLSPPQPRAGRAERGVVGQEPGMEGRNSLPRPSALLGQVSCPVGLHLHSLVGCCRLLEFGRAHALTGGGGE